MKKIWSIFRGSSSGSSGNGTAGEGETPSYNPDYQGTGIGSSTAENTSLLGLDDASRCYYYTGCVSKEEKVAWVQSPYGQFVLSKRPVLLQYSQTGYLLRLFDNKHWKLRLEEWLTLYI